jgi:hypothetical protein
MEKEPPGEESESMEGYENKSNIERRKGEWISTQNPQWKAYWHEKCSVCGWWNTKNATPGRGMKPRDFKFCPVCGAEMTYRDNG